MTALVTYSRDPELRWDRSTLEWVVLREFQVTWDRGYKAPWYFYVPAGFRTDLASIPKAAQCIVSVMGPNIQAAITHDFCYVEVIRMRGREMTKWGADQLFLDGLASLGVPSLRRKMMYAAVRLGGRGRWVSAEGGK